MKWIELADRLPEVGEEVIFDGGENGLIYGQIDRVKSPSIIVQESSGEQDYEEINKYARWLDETPAPTYSADDMKAFAEWCGIERWGFRNAVYHATGEREWIHPSGKTATTSDLLTAWEKQKA